MGILRILLALSVAIGHYKMHFPHSVLNDVFPYLTGGWIHGAMKVNCFFIIAGFYTQLMLQEKFAGVKRLVIRFYKYRLIRLLPCYYLVLFALLPFSLLAMQHHLYILDLISAQAFQPIISKLLTNITVAFIPPDFNLGYFSPLTLKFAVWHHLWIIQSWALFLDLVFIALAPFFLLHIRRFWLLVAVSFLLAAYYYLHGRVIRDYIGASLVYFMVGCILYKFYHRYLRDKQYQRHHRVIAYILVGGIAIGMIGFNGFENAYSFFPVYFTFMGVCTFSLPFIAAFTRDIKFDRVIGELAYPVYLSHALFCALSKLFLIQNSLLFVTTGCGVFAVSCYLLIDQPLQRKRQHMLVAWTARE